MSSAGLLKIDEWDVKDLIKYQPIAEEYNSKRLIEEQKAKLTALKTRSNKNTSEENGQQLRR